MSRRCSPSAGLEEGVDYETVLLDGFDPLAHWALDGIVGFPGYKSNEPGQLERAGIAFDLFDPTDYDIPGSFGVLYTTQEFIDEHPTAAQDFLRASMRGLADAVADPAGAAATAIALVEAGGNPSFLSAEGETFRWSTDAALLEAQGGAPMGVPELDGLQAEVGRLRRRRAVRRRRRTGPHRGGGRRSHQRRLRRRRRSGLAELDAAGEGAGAPAVPNRAFASERRDLSRPN